MVPESRNRPLNALPSRAHSPVVYWMSRDQRAEDNWALLTAQKKALDYKVPLIVVFCIQNSFLGATRRQFHFMIKGLVEVEATLLEKNIPFKLLEGAPQEVIPEFLKSVNAGLLVTDMSPLRIGREWREQVAKKIDVLMLEVDAHNIVPVWVSSDKKEFAAYTIRKKINGQLPTYLTEYPHLLKHRYTLDLDLKHRDWQFFIDSSSIDQTVREVDWITPGTRAAHQVFDEFLNEKIHEYDILRNDPNKSALSNLSSYLHFGQISAQTVALRVKNNSSVKTEDAQTFLEELIVRRELADNFCFYESKYDSLEGFHDWAKTTLEAHRDDPREYMYTIEEWENCQTHDPLWNAAQNQMKVCGKMHGFLRMYWAKKILEWSESPEEALRIANYLNDRYELDGRDPSGYVGVAWSIGGVHDRAWNERPVFGKIRYMNYNGCKRKFDVKAFEKKWGL
jgi:deoxyribodipyrimidine photo-lyase